MDSGPASWQLPPGRVRRQLKSAAGLQIGADDFAPDEADQLRLWADEQQTPNRAEVGRHRNGGGRRRRPRGG